MFESIRFAFVILMVFLLSNYGVQCYYPQPAPYAPYSPYAQPYPYMGQYAPVQPPSWNHFYPPYPYAPSAAAPAFAPANAPTFMPAAEPINMPPVATPAPMSPPSPNLPIIDFKKGSIIDYEYFYDTLPEDFGKTRIIIMLNKTSSTTVPTSQTTTVTSKPVFNPPSFELTEDRSTEEDAEKFVDEETEATTDVTEEATTDYWSNEDVTEESVTDEVTTEEQTEDTLVTDDSSDEDDEDTNDF